MKCFSKYSFIILLSVFFGGCATKPFPTLMTDGKGNVAEQIKKLKENFTGQSLFAVENSAFFRVSVQTTKMYWHHPFICNPYLTNPVYNKDGDTCTTPKSVAERQIFLKLPSSIGRTYGYKGFAGMFGAKKEHLYDANIPYFYYEVNRNIPNTIPKQIKKSIENGDFKIMIKITYLSSGNTEVIHPVLSGDGRTLNLTEHFSGTLLPDNKGYVISGYVSVKIKEVKEFDIFTEKSDKKYNHIIIPIKFANSKKYPAKNLVQQKKSHYVKYARRDTENSSDYFPDSFNTPKGVVKGFKLMKGIPEYAGWMKKGVKTALQRQQQEKDMAVKIAERKHANKVNLISNAIRDERLSPLLSQWGQAYWVCKRLNKKSSSVSKFVCADKVDSRFETSSAVRSCEREQRKLIRRYENDMEQPCQVSQKFRQEFTSIFGWNHSDAIDSIIEKESWKNHRQRKSMLENNFPYTKDDFSDIMETALSRANNDMRAENKASMAASLKRANRNSIFNGGAGMKPAWINTWKKQEAFIKSFTHSSKKYSNGGNYSSLKLSTGNKYKSKLNSIDQNSMPQSEHAPDEFDIKQRHDVIIVQIVSTNAEDRKKQCAEARKKYEENQISGCGFGRSENSSNKSVSH